MVVYETDDSSTRSTVTVPESSSSSSQHHHRPDYPSDKIKQFVALKKIDTIKHKKPQKKSLSVRFDLQQNKFFAIQRLKHMTEREKRRTWYQRSEMQRIKLDVRDDIRILKKQPHLIDNTIIHSTTTTTPTNDINSSLTTAAAASTNASASSRAHATTVFPSSSLICIRGLEADVFSDTIGKQRGILRILSKLVVFGLQHQLQQTQLQQAGVKLDCKSTTTNKTCCNDATCVVPTSSFSIAEEYQRITAASQEIAIRMGLLDQVMR